MGRSEGRLMDQFASFSPSESDGDEFTRSFNQLLRESEKSCLTPHGSDGTDRHIATLRRMIYRQLELVERENATGRNAEAATHWLERPHGELSNIAQTSF